jgi:uncharacterized membrane protein
MREDEIMNQPSLTETAATAARTADPAAAAEIPHACAPGTEVTSSATDGRETPQHKPRLLGIDAARGIALFGMASVHLLSDATAAGDVSLSWALAAGKSAALFAVLAGVGIAFSTGGTSPLAGPRRTAAASSLAVRALMIGVLGLLLGSVVPGDTAGVILTYYAVLFLLAIPLLGLSVRALVVLGAVTALVVPVLSHVVRGGMAVPALGNPTFVDLLSRPGPLVAELTLSGLYPALPWLAYVCAGLAIGRSRLTSRRFVIGMTAAGVALAALANAVSWILMERAGGRDRLRELAPQTFSSQEFTDVLAWGADGTLPPTSPWWLAVRAPHTATPVELLYTIGIAMAVIGTSIMLAWVLRSAIRPLAAVGSMPLTLYTLHLLLLVSPLTPEDGELASLTLHAVVLLTFAVLWGRRFDRGPLEHVIWRVTGRVRDRTLNRRSPA